MSNDLGQHPVSVEIAVAWGEMDSYQHVNNAVYARWIESGRIAYFARLGIVEQRGGVGPILARLAVDYRKPVTFPDKVRVDTAVVRIGGSSFTMGHRIWSEAMQAEAATGESVIVIYDYAAGRSAPVSDQLRAAIAAIGAGR